MADLNDVSELKQQVEELQRKADKASGALEGMMERLNSEFDCESIEEAEEKLDELEASEQEAKAEFESAFSEFEEEWGVVLEEANGD